MIIGSDDYKPKWVPGTQWQVTTHQSGGVGGSILIKQILGDKRFDFPKSLYAVRDSIRLITADKPDALVIDFFAGSGTTLHAVNLLNAEDGGHRRCILVTNNEVSDAEAKEMSARGLKPGDEEWEKLGIARYVGSDTCWELLRTCDTVAVETPACLATSLIFVFIFASKI